MANELSQEQLEEMVNGKPAKPRCVFYESATLDHEASKAAGRRVYTAVVMCKLTQPGVHDWTAYHAQADDFLRYPEEYEYYLTNRQGTRSPSIDIIPGLEMVHKQELIDYGLATIDKLCAAKILPQHLMYAQDSARRLRAALNQETGRNGETRENQEQGNTGERRDVLAPAGQDNVHHVGRPVPPQGSESGSLSTGGVHPGGPDNGGQGATDGSRADDGIGYRLPNYNWDWSLNVRN